MINVPFFRFSPQLSEDVAMDEKSDEKLVNMLWETMAYMESNRKEVQKLAVILNCKYLLIFFSIWLLSYLF